MATKKSSKKDKVETGVDLDKYTQLTEKDFKKDMSFYPVETSGQVSSVPVQLKGSFAQQSAKFEAHLLRGGAYVPVQKKKASKKAATKKETKEPVKDTPADETQKDESPKDGE